MGKYKVGDKVLVKATISEVNDGTFPNMPYSATVVSKNEWKGVGVEKGKTIEIGEDAIADMTAEEAWEIAKKLFSEYKDSELNEIFGKDWLYPKLMELTPQEIKAKIEAWEAAKEIKVGDEVAIKRNPNNDDYKFFVTYINNKSNEISGLSGFDGGVFFGRDINLYQKTGRHIDIEGLLKQIGGDE